MYRILIIEDDFSLAEATKKQIESWGSEVVCVQDFQNVIMAMNMGGDDFITKPIDLDVMISKLQAILRRSYDMGTKIPVLEHRGAILNLNDTSLTYNGERIELTQKEVGKRRAY